MSKKQVDLTGQVILGAIPSFITQFIAFYRIGKAKDGGLMILGVFGGAIGLQMLLPFPYGLVSAIIISVAIPINYIIKWTKLYNKDTKQTQLRDSKEKTGKKQNEKSLKILKERLAKGEITKEEYDELKKEFE